MEADIETTLPQLHIFNSLTGPLYDDLRNLLCAWIVSRAEEGLGYVEGAAKARLDVIRGTINTDFDDRSVGCYC